MKQITVIFLLMVLVQFNTKTVLSLSNAEYQEGLNAYDKGDYTTALVKLRPFAENGWVRAQFYLGRMYEDGLGITKNDKQASKWYLLCVEKFPEVQFLLGRMYEEGRGIEQNYLKAAELFQRASIFYYLREMYEDGPFYHLAVLYEKGLGVPKDYEMAMKYYMQDAKENNQSMKWLISAAQNGNAEAQYYLGEKDKSLKWLTLAAEQGHAWALTLLGIIYAGENIYFTYFPYYLGEYYKSFNAEVDLDKASKFFLLAAEQKSGDAILALSYMHFKGIGVAKTPDHVEAYKWLLLIREPNREIWATHQPEDWLGERLENYMTESQISQALKLKEECVIKNYKDC